MFWWWWFVCLFLVRGSSLCFPWTVNSLLYHCYQCYRHHFRFNAHHLDSKGSRILQHLKYSENGWEKPVLFLRPCHSNCKIKTKASTTSNQRNRMNWTMRTMTWMMTSKQQVSINAINIFNADIQFANLNIRVTFCLY